MAEPKLPEIEERVGIVYFGDSWRREYFVPRRDGQNIECAACGRHFVARAQIATLSATRFSFAMREMFLRDVRSFGWDVSRHLGGLRLAICPSCAERLA